MSLCPHGYTAFWDCPTCEEPMGTRGAMKEMTDAETAAHLRHWVATMPHDAFSWPTDGCGYHQHLRFVEHRNNHWQMHPMAAENLKIPQAADFGAFVLAYAESLEAHQPLHGDHPRPMVGCDQCDSLMDEAREVREELWPGGAG